MLYLDKIIHRDAYTLKDKNVEAINQEYHYHLSEGLFNMLIIKFDGALLDENKNLDFILDRAKQSLILRLSDISYDLQILPIKSYVYVFINYSHDGKSYIRKSIRNVLEDLSIQEDILKGLKVTIAIGDTVENISEIEKSFKNGKNLLEERLLKGTGRILEGNVQNREKFIDTKYFSEFNKQMMYALESLDTIQVRRAIRKLADIMINNDEITGHEILQMTKEVCNLYLFFIKSQRMNIEDDFLENYSAGADNCASAEELFDYLIKKISISFDRASNLKKQEDNRPIRLTKQYINEHYKEPITLEDVSLVAGLSSTYLSTVFKKDTGMTFLEYLSKVRMEEAKNLLKSTNISIASICEEVGYNDVRHFTKLFIKYSGLKPNEYRKLYS